MCVITTALVTNQWHVVAYTRNTAKGDIEEFDNRELAEKKARRIVEENPGCFYLPPTEDRKIFVVASSSSDQYTSRAIKLPDRFDRRGRSIGVNLFTPCPENSVLQRRFQADSESEAANMATQAAKPYGLPFVLKFFEQTPNLQFVRREYIPSGNGPLAPTTETFTPNPLGAILIDTDVGFELTFGSMEKSSVKEEEKQ